MTLIIILLKSIWTYEITKGGYNNNSTTAPEYLRNISSVARIQHLELKQKGMLNVLMEIADCNCESAKLIKLPKEYYNPLNSKQTKIKIAEKYFKEIKQKYRNAILMHYYEYRVWGPVQKKAPIIP